MPSGYFNLSGLRGFWLRLAIGIKFCIGNKPKIQNGMTGSCDFCLRAAQHAIGCVITKVCKLQCASKILMDCTAPSNRLFLMYLFM